MTFLFDHGSYNYTHIVMNSFKLCLQVGKTRRNIEGWKSFGATETGKTPATCAKRIGISKAQEIEAGSRGFRTVKGHWPRCFWRGISSFIYLFFLPFFLFWFLFGSCVVNDIIYSTISHGTSSHRLLFESINWFYSILT